MTIYSSGTFVGEGFIERMEQASTAMISFSIDSKVSLVSENGQSQEGLRLLRIVDGTLVSKALEINATTGSLVNRHEVSVTAYIKTSRRQGWKPRNQPAETATNLTSTTPARIVASW